MRNSNKLQSKNYANTFNTIITVINLLILFRVMILEIDVDFFRNSTTGSISSFGNIIKLSQSFIEGLTEPIVAPFKGLLSSFIDGDYVLINILAPIFTIVLLMIINLIVKLSMPYINEYLRKKHDI